MDVFEVSLYIEQTSHQTREIFDYLINLKSLATAKACKRTVDSVLRQRPNLSLQNSSTEEFMMTAEELTKNTSKNWSVRIFKPICLRMISFVFKLDYQKLKQPEYYSAASEAILLLGLALHTVLV